MFLKRIACAATAALMISAVPASAGTLLGNDVLISRIQGGTVVNPTSATVGGGFEYVDNFFRIDITANEVIFDAVAGFSANVRYRIEGLDFDGDPATPNVIENFTWSQIFGTVSNPFDATRVSFGANGALNMSFVQTTGGTDGVARITLGAPVAAPVPEPATWALMIGGLGLVGGAIRAARRRRDLDLAAA